jgi:hypothetical protein
MSFPARRETGKVTVKADQNKITLLHAAMVKV